MNCFIEATFECVVGENKGKNTQNLRGAISLACKFK